MASIINRPLGHKWIQFAALDGNRKTLRFGKISKRTAAEYCRRIELLVEARESGTSVEPETARWVADLPTKTHAKLARVKLVAARTDAPAATLGVFLDAYSESRRDVKESTRLVYENTIRCLKTHFKPTKPLRDISPADAAAFRAWLITDGNTRDKQRDNLSENTVRRRIKLARQFFASAVKAGLITSNPFEALKGQTRGNPDREYFIEWPDFCRVVEACPSLEWKLIALLARIGGLRIPSEIFCLKWNDVDFKESKMIIRAMKTEHHENSGIRVMPIFPELRPILEQVRASAKPGAEFVIVENRLGACNLRTRFQKIIRRAGVKPWPKLFQNLRASRVTELLSAGGQIKPVSQWMGHSPKVAIEFYAQVTETHFQQAITIPTAQIGDQKAQAKAQALDPKNEKQKRKHSIADFRGDFEGASINPLRDKDLAQPRAVLCNSLQTLKIGLEGLEPPTKGL